MTKWIAYAVVACPNVTGRSKERIAQSKRALAGSLAIVDSFGRFRFVCLSIPYYCLSQAFCFVFVFFLSLKSRPFVQSFFDMHAPRPTHIVT